ncbi:Replication factor C, subunit RFC4 [Handroanthus impetiginosus]|uniref:Replication factor C, subunit RFC4 n=1 Tax=Handroanthus impetiginosus TaxID=429701 RepID=A0A2G9I702_9LAMI|nr:Replication factor C, subunit RFC4 [Handroanthus impetiginosus]
MDGRRHSIDVPISRTLIALRRVRSLRDPSTNSMSKLSSLVDNLNWETNSNNGITLGFENGCCRGTNDNDVSSTLCWEEERHVSDHELHYGSRRCDPRFVSHETVGCMVERGVASRLDPREIVCDNVALSERYCKGLEFTHATPSSDCVEGGVSCNEPDEISMQAENRHRGGSKCKIWQQNLDRLSRATAGHVSSRAGSPCLSISEAPKGGPSRGLSLYRNEDVGFMESCRQGCGISSCWLRTAKFRESNVLPNVEEQPLLLENAGQDWKHNSERVSPYIESPRSLCQKFMPKSFNELVGQSTVATSLLSAISSRQIASLYLFHGPRGSGKTSASRVFAAALNCLSPDISGPCGSCQECVLFFSGRSMDVKEVDSVRINRTSRCRSLVKNAGVPPVFSQYKVYIIDECHMLHRETWAIILCSLEELPRHVVFIMISPNLDKLPHSAVSKSQRYHFQKVKEVDIFDKLEKICVQEGFEFDQDALNFIATKSNGSLRDAEMTLDQLSLLGKKITVSLVYEVNGVVSDDELLDLLYLALSSDASNTVKRARELMRSRIDPLQLISQLANLIMDILAGKCPDGVSEVRRKLLGTENSEADMQQLSHALKVLSQTEKQLRMSKNQTTWLTVALLQLGSAGSLHDVTDARLSMRSLNPQDGDFRSASSTCESLKHPLACTCEHVKSGKTGMQEDDKETLESVWIQATRICTSNSLKKFLQKRGKLVSIHLTQGIAVAELEFGRPDYVSKAEKSWKEIAGALQLILGYNVELRMNLARDTSNRHEKFKKLYFTLFNCSRKVHLKSQFSTDCGSNASENSDVTSTIITKDRYVETCSSDCGSQTSRACCHGKGLFKTIRNNDGNALSIGVNTPNGLLPDCKTIEDKSRACPLSEGLNEGLPHSVAFKPESKRGPRERSKFHCWRTATFPFRKAWQLRHQSHSERLVDYALHCAAAN